MQTQTYKRRPATIEAFQWKEGDIIPGITHTLEAQIAIDGIPTPVQGMKTEIVVMTMQGHWAKVHDGDWIIKEAKDGCYYPCDPEVFAETYDLVEDAV